MEWCWTLERTLPPERLLALCGLANLPALCADVYEVGQVCPASDDAAEQRAEISCVWGVFETRRTAVRNGVRYELLSCPNALQWTVTTRNGQTTLHGSVNQMAPDPEFAETLHDFLDAFRRGLLAADRA